MSEFKITATTTFNDVVKNKAKTVGDKVFLTYIRDFDKGLDEKYTYRDIHIGRRKCLKNQVIKPFRYFF